MIHVINDQGAVLHVRVVLRGELYGHEDCLTHDSDRDPLVQFYAADVYPEIHGPRGYLISYYYLSTLEQSAGGILLDSWKKPYSTATAENVAAAIAYANKRLAERLTKT